MEENSKSGLYLVAIVGIVAVVGLVIIVMNSASNASSNSQSFSGDNAGQAIAVANVTPICGDGIIQPANGEQCDYGNTGLKTLVPSPYICNDPVSLQQYCIQQGYINETSASIGNYGSCNYWNGAGWSSKFTSGAYATKITCYHAPNGQTCTPPYGPYGSACTYCNASCQLQNNTAYCGDNIAQYNYGEQCDNGSLNGVPCVPYYGGLYPEYCNYCNSTCKAVLVTGGYCGDGIIQTASGEQCDNKSFAGQTCQTRGYTNGTLKCSSTCKYDTTACNTPPSCTDSDGGLNYYVKGIANDSTGNNWIDVCMGGANTLYEGNCATNGSIIVQSYTCPNGCSNGACMNTPSCTDSDGGINENITGTVSEYYPQTGYTYNSTDFCSTNSTLNEFYCGGGDVASSANITCNVRCISGRCQ